MSKKMQGKVPYETTPILLGQDWVAYYKDGSPVFHSDCHMAPLVGSKNRCVECHSEHSAPTAVLGGRDMFKVDDYIWCKGDPHDLWGVVTKINSTSLEVAFGEDDYEVDFDQVGNLHRPGNTTLSKWQDDLRASGQGDSVAAMAANPEASATQVESIVFRSGCVVTVASETNPLQSGRLWVVINPTKGRTGWYNVAPVNPDPSYRFQYHRFPAAALQPRKVATVLPDHLI